MYPWLFSDSPLWYGHYGTSPWCLYQPGSTVPSSKFRRQFVMQQYLTWNMIGGSVGNLTSVPLTLGVHSLAISVKNAGAVTQVQGRNAQAEEPMLDRFSWSDWLKWLPLGIRGCGRLRITEVTDSGLIICSRHSDSVDAAKKSKQEKNTKGLWVGREVFSISRHTPLPELHLEQATRLIFKSFGSEPRSNFIK